MKKSTIYYLVALVIAYLTFIWVQKFTYIINLSIDLWFFYKGFQVDLTMFSGIMFLIGFIVSFLLSLGTRESMKYKIDEYQKQLGTQVVDSHKEKSKIEALERKIATLEKALESKLEDK